MQSEFDIAKVRGDVSPEPDDTKSASQQASAAMLRYRTAAKEFGELMRAIPKDAASTEDLVERASEVAANIRELAVELGNYRGTFTLTDSGAVYWRDIARASNEAYENRLAEVQKRKSYLTYIAEYDPLVAHYHECRQALSDSLKGTNPQTPEVFHALIAEGRALSERMRAIPLQRIASVEKVFFRGTEGPVTPELLDEQYARRMTFLDWCERAAVRRRCQKIYAERLAAIEANLDRPDRIDDLKAWINDCRASSLQWRDACTFLIQHGGLKRNNGEPLTEQAVAQICDDDRTTLDGYEKSITRAYFNSIPIWTFHQESGKIYEGDSKSLPVDDTAIARYAATKLAGVIEIREQMGVPRQDVEPYTVVAKLQHLNGISSVGTSKTIYTSWVDPRSVGVTMSIQMSRHAEGRAILRLIHQFGTAAVVDGRFTLAVDKMPCPRFCQTAFPYLCSRLKIATLEVIAPNFHRIYGTRVSALMGRDFMDYLEQTW